MKRSESSNGSSASSRKRSRNSTDFVGSKTLRRHLIYEHGDIISRFRTGREDLAGDFVFDLEKAQKGLVHYLVQSEHPLLDVENDHLTRFLRSCQPGYRKFSRKKARAIVLSEFKTVKDTLIGKFMSLSCRFAISCDTWKGECDEHEHERYTVVDCSWIDDDWVLQKRTLALKPWEEYECSHSGASIARVISDICRDYKISERIFSISLDNASSNFNTVTFLKHTLNPILDGVFSNNKCVCHILNSCVQDGLQLAEFAVTPILNIFNLVRHSTPKRLEFKRLCVAHNVPYKHFKYIDYSRWNSILDTLKCALPFKDILIEFSSSNCENSDSIDSSTFDFLSSLVDLLEVFHECIEFVTPVYCPTAHRVIHLLPRICQAFDSFPREGCFGDIVFAMKSKFLKYYEEIPVLYLIAAILDPRVKLDRMKTLLELFACSFSNDVGVYVNISKLQTDALLILKSLYEIYAKDHDMSKVVSSSSSSNKKKSFYELIRENNGSSSSGFNELYFYNCSSRLVGSDDDEFNILNYWKYNSVYPILSKIARDVLTHRVSTVARRSVFNLGGRTLQSHQSDLSEKTLEACICLKDWNQAMERKQDSYSISSSDEDYDDEDEISSA